MDQKWKTRLWRSHLLKRSTYEHQSLKSAYEHQTLEKSASYDQNLSQSKRNDQGDTDRSLFITEHTFSFENLRFIFFIESVGIQLLIPFVEKVFQTSFHLTWQFCETSHRLFWSFSKDFIMLHLQQLFSSLFMKIKDLKINIHTTPI